MAGRCHLCAETQSLPLNQGFDDCKAVIIETTDATRLLRPDAASTRTNGLG